MKVFYIILCYVKYGKSWTYWTVVMAKWKEVEHWWCIFRFQVDGPIYILRKLFTDCYKTRWTIIHSVKRWANSVYKEETAVYKEETAVYKEETAVFTYNCKLIKNHSLESIKLFKIIRIILENWRDNWFSSKTVVLSSLVQHKKKKNVY